MRKVLLLVAVSAALMAGVLAGRSRTDEPNQVAGFMQLKLEHSKKVLEGLALEDYDLIARHSNDMALLSQEANWQVLQTEEYLLQSTEFRRAANALNKAAREKNLDGAALAYVSLTMKCVNCHKYVRDVRMGRFEPSGPLRPITR
jgi:cytochrome c556